MVTAQTLPPLSGWTSRIRTNGHSVAGVFRCRISTSCPGFTLSVLTPFVDRLQRIVFDHVLDFLSNSAFYANWRICNALLSYSFKEIIPFFFVTDRRTYAVTLTSFENEEKWSSISHPLARWKNTTLLEPARHRDHSTIQGAACGEERLSFSSVRLIEELHSNCERVIFAFSNFTRILAHNKIIFTSPWVSSVFR